MTNKLSKSTVRCPRGEIGRHKGLKSRGIHKVVSYFVRALTDPNLSIFPILIP